ncbi:hypothetical protein CTA1_4650 [Colletotrichum tanaceti]|uniref:Uncharacterized protein n=1 Tax=Colletotrichum tanaceti TaxID=1306861 RepID=A0A4U6X3Y0_9PEZI|nr:hypothetical protein CTA1_4650 [Colletotrichum tanaceti]
MKGGFSPKLAALSPTCSSSSGTPTATLLATLIVVRDRSRSPPGRRAPAMPAPPVVTPTPATVPVAAAAAAALPALSLPRLLSRTSFSRSRILCFSASFSLLTFSNSWRCSAVSSYLDVVGMRPGDSCDSLPPPGVWTTDAPPPM